MKLALIDIIANQNKHMNGGFINHNVEDYVEKIFNNANIR